jgi:hypothetical protein
VVVQPIPIPASDRLIVVWETDRDTGTTREPGSFPDFLDFRERTRTLEQLAAFTATEVNLTPDEGDPIRLAALSVTGGFFPLVGLLVLGLALAQWLRGWWYGVTPVDPITIGGVLLVLGAVAALSSYFPTRRATRIDPAVALRAE